MPTLENLETPTTDRFPKITEEGLSQLRKRIGVPITDTVEPWNHEATRDGIRHYAHGIGDDNPLWTDPGYAARSKFGTIVAPPSFLFSTSRIASGYCGGLSGVHAMWAGADWTWYKHVLRGDVISTTAYLKDLSGRPAIESTDALGHTVRDVYDAFGRVLTHYDAVQMARKANGVAIADLKTTTYAYHDESRILVVTTPEGVQMTTVRNFAGDILSVSVGGVTGVDPIRTTSYAYNQDGQVTAVIDAVGQAHQKGHRRHVAEG